MSRDDEPSTIFLVFYRSNDGNEIFEKAFYTYEKAEDFCSRYNERLAFGSCQVKTKK